MDSRSAKRKRYTDIKNMLINDLHKLTVDSTDLNSELIAASEDFSLMFKSMEDRQNQHLTRLLLLEEKYADINNVLNQTGHVAIGESSSGVHGLPTSYSGDVRKYVNDSSTSLAGHVQMLMEHVDEISALFKKYGDAWNKTLDEIRGHAEVIAAERSKLRTNLFDYSMDV